MQLLKNNLIGISGKIGSGKDTVGSMLQYISTVDYPTFKEYEFRKFADKIKDTACLWLGCTREQLEDREFKEKELGEEWRVWYNYRESLGPDERFGFIYPSESAAKCDGLSFGFKVKQTSYVLTPRKILQLLGTDAGRMIIHPNIWVNSMFSGYGEDSRWIITDVRFPNEVEAIKKRGGVVIRVERDMDDPAKCLHQSETALDQYQEFDLVINNNKSINELYEQIRANCK